MLPVSGGNGLRHGLRPVDLGSWRLSLGRGSLVVIVCLFLALGTGCGPSDEDVARAAEEAAGRLAAVLLANTGCSISEAFSGGGPATTTLQRYSDRMESETDLLSDEGDASNREKMKVIDDMNRLAEDWEADLEELGCEMPGSS